MLERLERREEALASYDRAIALDPKDSLTHYNRGSVLKDLKRFEEALASYDSAIGLNGDFAEAYVNRGNVLQELRRHEAAIESFGRAIALNPAIAEAFQGRGVSPASPQALGASAGRLQRGNCTEAGSSLLRTSVGVISLRNSIVTTKPPPIISKPPSWNPDAGSYQALAASLLRLKRFDLAIASLDKATALDPDGITCSAPAARPRCMLVSGMAWTRTSSASPKA